MELAFWPLYVLAPEKTAAAALGRKLPGERTSEMLLLSTVPLDLVAVAALCVGLFADTNGCGHSHCILPLPLKIGYTATAIGGAAGLVFGLFLLITHCGGCFGVVSAPDGLPPRSRANRTPLNR